MYAGAGWVVDVEGRLVELTLAVDIEKDETIRVGQAMTAAQARELGQALLHAADFALSVVVDGVRFKPR